MKLIELYDFMLSGAGHFTTREMAQATGSRLSKTSKNLSKLAALGKVIKIGRGRWVVPAKTNRLRLPEFLSDAPTYCTAHTALSHHGMIEQIPEAIHAVTTGRGRRAQTPFGPVQIHRIAEPLFRGWTRTAGMAKIACPEKALVDLFYLGITGHPHFQSLPEVEIPRGFSWRRAHRFTKDIHNAAWRSAVASKLNAQEKSCALTASQDSAEM